MRRLIFVFGLVILFVAGCSVSGSSSAMMIGKKAPLAQLYMLDGDQTSLNLYEGKTVVLLFWAQWCTRSQRLVRELAKFASAHNKSKIVVIGVDIDKESKIDDLKTLIYEENLDSIIHTFSGNEIHDEAYVAFDAGEVPLVYIINPAGVVVAQGTSYEVIEEYFKLR